MLDDEAGVLQYLEVLRDRRAADGQTGGELADGLGSLGQGHHDRPSGAVPEGAPTLVILVSLH